jgi:hypothetical protein
MLSVALLVVQGSEAQGPVGKSKYKAFGGAKKALGAAKLQRIASKLPGQHKTADELAKILDWDPDIVSCMGTAVGPLRDAACMLK